MGALRTTRIEAFFVWCILTLDAIHACLWGVELRELCIDQWKAVLTSDFFWRGRKRKREGTGKERGRESETEKRPTPTAGEREGGTETKKERTRDRRAEFNLMQQQMRTLVQGSMTPIARLPEDRRDIYTIEANIIHLNKEHAMNNW